MIMGAEIGLLVYGIIALIRGQFKIGKGKKVYGANARVLGVISLLPLPMACVSGFALGVMYPQTASVTQMKLVIAGMELAILACIVSLVLLLGNKFYKSTAETLSVAGV